MRIPLPTARRRVRIEIIPLIDIVFFLLATFVMVSMSMIKNQGILVSLPAAATSTEQERSAVVTLSVDAGGAYFWDKEPLSFEQMSARLKELKNQQVDPRILINADETAAFGKAIAILDEVRRIGIAKVAIRTKTTAR